MTDASPAYPLAGVRVVELARILAGPWAGQTLADLGADVIKVESPDGDDTRQWGPPFVDNGDGTRDAAYFHAANRGKRSVVANFADAADVERILALIDGADVVIENFKVGGLAKYGLDYASLAARNPRLIYCSITGFGQDGPYAARAGYDFIIQGMSGLMDVTGTPDGEPQKVGLAVSDLFSGLYAVIGIQAALAERDRSGLGQQVDIALFDVMTGVMANQALNYLVSGRAPTRMGNAHPNISPYEAYASRTGWVIIAVGNDRQYRKVAEILDIPDDPRFVTNADRLRHRAALKALMTAAVSGWGRDELLAALETAGVPAGPINSIDQAFDDPQIRHRGMVIEMEHAGKTPVRGVRSPLRFSRSAVRSDCAPPVLGQGLSADW